MITKEKVKKRDW